MTDQILCVLRAIHMKDNPGVPFLNPTAKVNCKNLLPSHVSDRKLT